MESTKEFASLLQALALGANKECPDAIKDAWGKIQDCVGTFQYEDGAIVIDSSSDDESHPPKKVCITLDGTPPNIKFREVYVQCVRVKALMEKRRVDGDLSYYVKNVLRKAVVNALK